MPETLFDKIWNAHVVADLGRDTRGDMQLLHVDRHITCDLGGERGLEALTRRGLAVRNPELTFATPDHLVSTEPGRTGGATPLNTRIIDAFRAETRRHSIRLFDVDAPEQGIVHVIGPELGLVLPGALVVCADSHTCTNGGLGAVGFGIGASEFLHVLATQTIVQKRPKTMLARFAGRAGEGVHAKDMILALIGALGASGGSGYAVEYAGEAVRALSPEGRLTLCNLSIEMGAKIGLVAPDDTIYDYVHGRPYAPRGPLWDLALAHWKTLPSDPGARYDAQFELDCSGLAPQITWGTSPEHVLPVDGVIPDPDRDPDPARRRAQRDALEYMGLAPGVPIAGTRIDRVFIGSCTNSRLSDLQSAARVVGGRKVAPGVRAWVVPGSGQVKREAEAQGLDRLFREAGFEWREPGCSMCLAANGDTVEPRARCVSTSNRNFVGRQGPLARTHLASPAMAAAAAIAGEITDVRRWL